MLASNFFIIAIWTGVVMSVETEIETPNPNAKGLLLNAIQKLIAPISNSSKQIAVPSDPIGEITSRLPCECDKGVCKCCIGSGLQIIGMEGCVEVIYIPEDFAFEFRVRMNEHVFFKNKLSGKNPPPVCFRPPRFQFAKACVTFYDVYFFGRNMHVCMDLGAYVQGFRLYSRSFDCLQMGAKGVKRVKPEDGYPIRPVTQFDNDDDDDEEIEDYDENLS